MGGAGAGNALADDLVEVLFNVLAQHEDDARKACLDRVVDGILHQELSVGADGFQLLDPAAEARADARRHDDKGNGQDNPSALYSSLGTMVMSFLTMQSAGISPRTQVSG